MPKRFYLSKRGSVFYVRFRIAEPFGKDRILNPVSSGERNEKAAEEWAEKNHPVKRRPELELGDQITFADYSSGWYLPEHEWVIREQARREEKFAAAYLRSCRTCLKIHILPAFGKAHIGAITTRHIEDWLFALRAKGKSTSTCNRILSALRHILAQAARDRVVMRNAAAGVKNLRQRAMKRGVLSTEEAEGLLAESAIKTVWGGSIIHYAISLLAAYTGMRIGEIQALQLQHVHLDGAAKWVQVAHGWRHIEGLSKPKWGLEHPAPLDNKVAKWLSIVIVRSGCTEPEDLIFHADEAEFARAHPGANAKRSPINERYVVTRYKAALQEFGVDHKARNIPFHSWRHYWISELRRRNLPEHVMRYFAGLPAPRRQDPNPVNALHDRIVRYLTGHRSDASEGYTHINMGDLNPVSWIEELVSKANGTGSAGNPTSN